MAVGWGWITAAARNHEVWVVCAEWQRENIEIVRRRNPIEYAGLHFAYVSAKPWHYSDSSQFWKMCERSLLKPIMNSAYRLWQRDAYTEVCKLHSRIHFDLAHQITFVGFRFPGHLWKLDIPFVWGPIGGLENTPWRLLPSMGARGAAHYAARNVVNSLHRRFLPSPRRAFGIASAVIAATSGIEAEILHWYGVSSEIISEVSAPSEIATEFAPRAPGEPLRIAWSGRHLPAKALNLLLLALSRQPESVDWRLDIFGDGPSRSGWERLARKLGIDARCTWHRQVSRDEVLRGLLESHLFVITSLKDLTSTVTIEALACGVPILCPDHCGFADAVTADCGIKLPINSARQFISALSTAIDVIDGDEELRRQLAAGALRRASDFSLDRKAERIDQIYARVVQTQRRASDRMADVGERDKAGESVAAGAG
jgi:glycosyltransferase involved in cell wall biosynthesis